MKSTSVTIQMKGIQQYCPIVLFTMLHNVVLAFEFVDEIHKCDHSNERHTAVLSYSPVYFAAQRGSSI